MCMQRWQQWWQQFWRAAPAVEVDPLYATVIATVQRLWPEHYAQPSQSLAQRYAKFEAVTWVMSYVLQQLRQLPGDHSGRRQVLVETMLDDFADNLREQGVSDLRVGPELRKLAAAFNGRERRYQPLWAVPGQAGLQRLMGQYLKVSVAEAQALLQQVQRVDFPLPGK